MKLTSCVRLAVVVLVLAFSGLTQASETVHLYLKVAGKDVQGESTQKSMGRENSIECIQFQHALVLNGDRKAYEPIVIRKRIDKSSPLLFRAAAANQECDAVFKFFRPNPIGDGTTEQFYTITLKGVRIIGVRQIVPNCIDPASSNYPPQEDVTFAFRSITWTYTNGNITADDRNDTAPITSPRILAP